nr:MAG TPA: hypothetical protein [Caudoviricetes sp.]
MFSTYITLNPQNIKSCRHRFLPKCILKNCAFYDAFCAVFMLISALSGETIVAGKCEVGSILS